jgi:hypothetical protein
MKAHGGFAARDAMNCCQVFLESFDKYFDLIANDYTIAFSRMDPETFCSFAAVMFYGSSLTLTKCFVNKTIRCVLNGGKALTTRKAEYDNVRYASSDVHIEVDLRSCGDPRDAITSFIGNHVCKIKNVATCKKHVVVLHNLDCLSQKCIFALRKIIEMHSSNVMFVMTCTRLSGINEAIKSRCTMVNCSVRKDKVLPCLEQFVEDNEIDDFEYDESLCLLTNLAQAKENMMDAKTRSFLKELKKQVSMAKVVDMCRGFSYEVLKYCEMADVLKCVLRNGGANVSLISAAASLEHQSHLMGKHFVLLERFLIQVYIER